MFWTLPVQAITLVHCEKEKRSQNETNSRSDIVICPIRTNRITAAKRRAQEKKTIQFSKCAASARRSGLIQTRTTMFAAGGQIGTVTNPKRSRTKVWRKFLRTPNLFIYLLEHNLKFVQVVEDLRRRMLRRHDLLLTSAMSVGEVLTKPLTTGNRELVDRYRAYFSAPNMAVSAFDLKAVEACAHIRQDRSIRAAAAIQLACAVAADVDLFITNDDRLSQKTVPGVDFFVTSLSRAPL